MAIIRTKRSTGTTAPGSNILKNGELAYTMGTGTQGNSGGRLFIGKDSNGSGYAATASVIGGKYFTDMLDHVAGVNTASSALIVDANKKLDELTVDFVSINNSTINSTGTNDLNLVPAANYCVTIDNQIKFDSDTITRVGSIDVGQITGLTSDLIPNADSAISLGSATKKWKDLFLSGGTIHIGGLTLSDNNGQLEVKDSDGVVKLDTSVTAGTTAKTATTIVDGDRFVMNDSGTMKQVTVEDMARYFDDEITAMPNLTSAPGLVTTVATSVGALDSGSITSGFGSIDVGADSVTTTGTMTAGKVVTDNITVDANTISSTNTNGNIVISPNGSGSIDVATSKIIGVVDPTDSAGAASKNYVDTVLDLQDLDVVTDSGTIAIDLDDETLTVAGGTGLGSVGSGNTVTLNIDATVATLTGSQTLTNKTLTTPNVSNPNITPSATAAGTIEFKEGTNNGTNRVLLQGPASTADATLTLPAATDTLVGKATTDTLTNKTLTTPVISNPTISPSATAAGTITFKEGTNNGTNRVLLQGPAATADVTITLPADSDTLVGRATTDTLTNKTLTSPNITTPIISAPVISATSAVAGGTIAFKEGTDNGTNRVLLQGPAATADVTVTLPAATDTLVGKATTDTLTNKTLTTPTITTPQVLNPNITPSATAAGTITFKEGTNNGTNSLTLQGAASTADVTVTLPASTDTLVGKATTDTFTNKSFDADGTGNSLTNIEVANLKSGVLDADITAVSTNDDTLPSAKAVKAYVDAKTINVVVGADSDTFNLLDSDMIFAAGEGMDVALSGNTVTFSGEDATVSNKGVASFATANFAVSSGAVTTKATTIGSTAINAGGTSTVLAGLTQIDVDNIRILDNTVGSTSGTLFIDPNPIDSDGGEVVIRGNLTIQGTQTQIRSTSLNVSDLNIVLADSAGNAAAADGAGFTVGGGGYSGTKATLTFNGSNDEWEVNKTLNVTAGSLEVGGVDYLEAVRDNLGGGVLVAGEGLDLTVDDGANTITFSGENATKNNKGIASFDSAGFGISSGHITLTQTDITSVGALDAGSITANFGNINPGASAITTTGDITGGGIHVTGDVTVGDDAAIGYTAAEGLILTGQGSTFDVTVKNDSDATVAGVPTGTTNLRFPDNSKATFGTADDLQIYHDASNSYVSDAGTGSLKLTGSVVEIEGSGETLAKFTDDGAAELYHNNVKKIETTSDGATVTGTLAATLSTASQPNVTTAAALTTVGALNAGSITSGFTSIDVGAGAITTTGIITGGTLEATTDTAAGDNAAIGYTAAEGLILTGQGSTNDVTIKNDLDSDVIEIPTGTTNVTIAGDLGVGDDLTVSGGVIKVQTNSGAVGKIDFYCEVSNAHFQTLQSQPHSAGSSTVSTLPAGANSTLVSRVSTDTLTNKTLTTPTIDQINATGFLVDASGDITLDAGGAEINFSDDGTAIGHISMASQNVTLKSIIDGKDIILQGLDGTATVNALTLDMSDSGTAIFSHNLSMVAGSEIIHAGDFNVDATGSITLDADAGNVKFKDASVTYGQIQNGSGSQFVMQALVSNQDMIFKVNDGGFTYNALTLDASDSGTAIFAHDITMSKADAKINHAGNLTLDVAGNIDLDADGGQVSISDGGTEIGYLYNSSSDFIIQSAVSDKDIKFNGNDGGVTTTALTLDMSDAGTATFNHDVKLPDNGVAHFGANSDIQIYSDDSDGYIKQGKGALRIATSASGVAVKIGHTTSETTINDNFTVVGTANFGAITTSSTSVVTNLNADKLDSQTGAYYRINVYNSGGTLLN